ncbi:hypothetical protein V6N13_079064 [Hibiscus sabdariffa]
MGTKLEYRTITGITNSQSNNSFSLHSMDGVLRIRVTNMESTKKTMQMHEEMFKYQVRELHRLYRVQKMLMDELKREITTNRLWATSTTSSRERSGSCSGDPMKAAKSFDLERLAEENSDEDSEIELTLSIGGGSSKKKKKKMTVKNTQPKAGEEIRELDSSGSFKSKRGEDSSGPNTPLLSSPWFKHKQDLTPLNNI